MKQPISKSAYFFLFLVVIFVLFLTGCANRPINLPDAGEIIRIELAPQRRFSSETIMTTDYEDVEAIMTALSTATLVDRRAMNDSPFGTNILEIRAYRIFHGEENLSARLFLYIDNSSGNEYLWNAYAGIYQLSEENINVIRQFLE